MSGVRCRLAYGPADATATGVSIGYTFLVPAHPGSPGQRAVKPVCVCVCGTHLFSLHTVSFCIIILSY